MFKLRVLAGLLLVTAVCRPASAFEWLDRMLGIDLDGNNTAYYQGTPPAGYSYQQTPAPGDLSQGYGYTALQPVPQPIPPGQAVAPLPQAAPVYPYAQPYYQPTSGNAFTNCVRDCCDGIKNGCRRFCDCICPPRAATAAVVAPIAYVPQPSQPVVPLAPIAPVPNPYAQVQPPMAPYSVPPQAIAPQAPMMEPSCQGIAEPSCAAAVETTCEASCMATQPVQAQIPYPVAVYAAPQKGFCQRLCECFCPPKQPAYYAAYPPAAPQQQMYYQPQAPAQPQAGVPSGETYSNVQWTDEIVPNDQSGGVQLQETTPGDATLQPALPPAPVPPTGD